MTVSSLTDECIWSPNTSGWRTADICKVTVHHMAADLSIETCGSVFANPSRQASSNYGVGSDGRIGCYLEEEYHPWTSASYWNDDRAITIEVADEDCENWVPSDAAYEATVRLCADICNRHGIEPTYTGDQYGTFTEHRMFAATACPGDWWHAHMARFVEDVKEEMEDSNMRPADVWEYNWEDTAPGGNMYNCVNDMYWMLSGMVKTVDALSEKVEALTKKVASGSVTVDASAIAKAVNDDAAKRMKA